MPAEVAASAPAVNLKRNLKKDGTPRKTPKPRDPSAPRKTPDRGTMRIQVRYVDPSGRSDSPEAVSIGFVDLPSEAVPAHLRGFTDRGGAKKAIAAAFESGSYPEGANFRIIRDLETVCPKIQRVARVTF